MDFYQGKRALIVGGSRGIGRALASHLAHHGATVCVTARGESELVETVASLPPAPTGAHRHAVLDVCDGPALLAARDRLLADLGGLDILVCASGAARAAAFLDAPADDFERMMTVNYLGHVNAVRAFGPALVARHAGTICLVSSVAAFMPIYGYAAYAASKAAIVAFAESLRQEMRIHGVKVLVHYPPTTDTPGLAEENRTKPAAVWALESESGWNRIRSADEVAHALAWQIARGVPHGLVGFDSWFLRQAQRFAPGLVRWIADGELQRALRQTSVAAAAAASGRPGAHAPRR